MPCQLCLIRKCFSQYHTITDTSPRVFIITGVAHFILTRLWGFLVIFCICFGFLCGQGSSENCETTESWKLAILSLKSWSQGSIFIYRTLATNSYEAKVFFFFFLVGCYQARHCLLWRRLAQTVLLIYCRFSKMWPSSYHGDFTGGEAVLIFYWSP